MVIHSWIDLLQCVSGNGKNCNEIHATKYFCLAWRIAFRAALLALRDQILSERDLWPRDDLGGITARGTSSPFV